jgi:hypothetical protein
MDITPWTKGTFPKTKCEGTDPDADEALNWWFSVITGQGVHVSGPTLKNESEELDKNLGHNNFKATDGRLS